MIAKGTGFLLEVVRECSRIDWGDAGPYLWIYWKTLTVHLKWVDYVVWELLPSEVV